MLFRIENNQENGGDGKIRNYKLSQSELPEMKMNDMEKYIAEEIRKEINGSSDRNLLSYSKSLGVCLMKYNPFSINELHIKTDNDNYTDNCITYCFDKKDSIEDTAYLNFDLGLIGLPKENNKTVIIKNIERDVSNNKSVNNYLKMITGVGLKKLASPEKDCEVLIMQSPNDLIISNYLHSIYLLYGLVLRYGMKDKIFHNLFDKIYFLEEYRFEYYPEERSAILHILNYFYEQTVIKGILDSSEKKLFPFYVDVPIIQVFKIQDKKNSFNAIYNDYYDDSDVVSQIILDCYGNVYYRQRRG